VGSPGARIFLQRNQRALHYRRTNQALASLRLKGIFILTEVVMQTKQWLVRSAVMLSVLGAAGLMTAVPSAAQTQKPSTNTAPSKPATVAAARAGEDDAAEFAKLDKNKDGFLDKAEAVMEPKVLAKWADADANKDGKISKEEFLAFERKEHPAKKQ
jgi:hypothetical protein